MSTKRLNAMCVVFCIVFVFGAIIGITNSNNISKSTLVDPNYVENSVREMRTNYIILGNDWDIETKETYESIYSGHVASGNASIAGLVLAGLSVLALSVCFFVKMHIKTTEQHERQAAVLATLAPKPEQTVKSRLIELNELKDKELITEEEYNRLRENVIK